uniref:NADH dehydrogenase subunit 6 n=1 Tax=Habronattus oregonensis TaxID=130930 RepID=Q6PYA0_HABOR|nr:NADH dehydrogenase subunit 6 [Habronattus oregonensis]AAT02492.1 NADH dehydrogenase subunit 6 [Habronattus oregonensis]
MMLVLLGMLFVSSIQPMFMISSMIMIVLLYSYMIYISMGGYWFSYALIMVMLSGVLVVFTYMVSLLPNEMFENYNFVYMVGMMILLLGGYFMVIYGEKWGVVSLNLWLSYVGMFNIFMVSFLLSIMLMVVWMSYMGYGALRI